VVDDENNESVETVVDGGKPGVRFQRQGETCWKERSEDKDLYYFSFFQFPVISMSFAAIIHF